MLDAEFAVWLDKQIREKNGGKSLAD